MEKKREGENREDENQSGPCGRVEQRNGAGTKSAEESGAELYALEAKGLSVWMKQGKKELPAVRDLSISVKKGGCTGIIGESGCGKSLSCQAILGLLEPGKWKVKGEVRLDGEPVPILDDKKMDGFRGRRMALILQNPLAAFDPRLTVGAHFCEGIPVWDRKKRAECLKETALRLKKMYIEEPEMILKSYPFQLSGGMLQRILTALALSRRPDILIADEPTTALDATTQHELIKLLQTLQREEGISILLVSHDLEVISWMADFVIVMYAGQAVEYGDAGEVLTHPAHPYTRSLFRSRPEFSKERLTCMDGYPPRLGEIPKAGCAFAPRCPKRAMGDCSVGDLKQSGSMSAEGGPELTEIAPGHFVRCWKTESAECAAVECAAMESSAVKRAAMKSMTAAKTVMEE